MRSTPSRCGARISAAAYTEYESRFVLEAQLGASLKHPNLLEVYNFGREPDGTLVLVMEYAPGGSLLDRLYPQHGGQRPGAG